MLDATNKISERIASLSPEQLKEFEQLLQRDGLSVIAPIIPDHAQDRPFPLSYSQERLWALAAIHTSQPAYNEPCGFLIEGTVTIHALIQSLEQMVLRHQLLRCGIEGEATAQFVVLPSPSLPLQIISLEHLPEEQSRRCLQHWCNALARRPLALKRNLLYRINLFRISQKSHFLMFTFHHILVDHWSFHVLWADLCKTYDRFMDGLAENLPRLPIQFADFTSWQRRQNLGAQLEFWKNNLQSFDEPLELTTDFARPPLQTFSGAQHLTDYSSEFALALAAFSRKSLVTPFMTLLASFVCVVHSYTRQSNIWLGTRVAGRQNQELEALVGFFINILPLHIDVAGDPTLQEVVQTAARATRDALSHQDVPFEQIAAEARSPRDSSRPNLVPIMISYLAVSQDGAQNPRELKITSSQIHPGTAKTDLDLVFEGNEKSLRLKLEYNVDLYRHSTIERLVKRHRELVHLIVNKPHLRMSEALALSDHDRTHVREKSRGPAKPFDFNQSLTSQLLTRTICHPDRVAYCFGDLQITYRALENRSNQLSRVLHAQGISDDAVVGICMDRSIEFVISLWAVLKAGAAYVPLDPTYPASHLAAIVRDAQPLCILTKTEIGIHFDHVACLCIDQLESTIAAADVGPPHRVVSANQLAYILYTSGSTGTPKGVMVQHRQVLNCLFAFSDRFPFASDDRVAQKTSACFAVSVKEFFSGLLQGIPTVIIADAEGRDPRLLAQSLSRHQVSRLFAVPSLMQSIAHLELQHPWDLQALTMCIVAGESLSAALLKQLKLKLPHLVLLNNYGCTELNDITYRNCSNVVATDEAMTVGHAIANTQPYVLDEHLVPVPFGAVGEICVSTIGLPRGYVARPDLTAERFVPDAFATVPGARLFRTGDRGRLHDNYEMELIGRADDQVKIRGFRVELRQVELCMSDHPAVQNPIVRVFPSPNGDLELVAFFTTSLAGSSTSDIRRFLLDRLPRFMVPGLLVPLETLPRLPNGKVDRRALVRPDQRSDLLGHAPTDSHTPAEQVLIGIWQDVLGISSIQPNDDFFELGGQSLRANQIMARLREIFLIDVSHQSFFREPTIAGLIDTLNSHWQDPHTVEQIASAWLSVQAPEESALSS
jgi:amino acid adenylation domain-containing protein